MRSLFGTIFFLIIAIMTAIFVGFGLGPAATPLANDDEQKGLDQIITIKFSHVVAENTPKGQAAQRFANLVEKKTNGQVKVEVFPNGMLYNDHEEINAIMKGEVHMIAPAFSKLSPFIPEWQVLDLPYIFPNYEAVEEAFSGEIKEHLFQTLKSNNLVGIAFWENGFKQMMTNKHPLILPEDFAGQNFRIMESQLLEDQFLLLGAKPKILSFNETYRHLANGLLDGQENTLSNIYSKKFHTVQKYMTISNHGYLGYAVLINAQFWDDLPEETRIQITEAMDEATLWLTKNARLINDRNLAQIKASDEVEIHEQTPEEKELWMEAFKPLYAKYEPIVGKKLMKLVLELQSNYSQKEEVSLR